MKTKTLKIKISKELYLRLAEEVLSITNKGINVKKEDLIIQGLIWRLGE